MVGVCGCCCVRFLVGEGGARRVLTVLPQVLALRQLVLMLCYFRLGCILLAASRVTVYPDVFLFFTLLAHTLDILCR